MTQPLAIDFKIVLGKSEGWVSVNQLLNHSDQLMDHYLSLESSHCCIFQGGFFINIDGISWSDEYTVDEFWMTSSWLKALKDILSGKAESMAFPWEESRLTLKLKGEELELEDIHWSGSVAMPKVRVPFLVFVEQILHGSMKFIQLITELENKIAFRRSHGVSEEVESKLKEIEQNIQGDYWRREVQDLAGLLSEYRDQKGYV
jgi:hypothetical protein